jgi:hypothetical protein
MGDLSEWKWWVGCKLPLLMVKEEWAAVAVVLTVELLIRGVGWALYSEMSSSACKSSALTHESCVGEYPFHLIRYRFFFHQPKVRCFRIVSTSHSGVSSMMSGGGSKKFGPCSGVSLYGVKRDAWKML